MSAAVAQFPPPTVRVMSFLAVSEKDTKLAQKLGQLQSFLAILTQECVGQLAYFGPT